MRRTMRLRVESQAARMMLKPSMARDTRRALEAGGKKWSRYVYKIVASVLEPAGVDDREFDAARDLMLAAPACCLWPAEARIRRTVVRALSIAKGTK